MCIERGQILPENWIWSPKTEFCVFEAEIFFIDHLEVAKFHIFKKKMKLELIFKNLQPSGYLENVVD